MAWRKALSFATAFTLLGFLPATLGCGNFFTCEGKAACPASGSTGGSNTGNIVYAANQSSEEINAYYLSSGKLYSVTGSPFTTSFIPYSMAVSRNNSYLYVASDAAIYSYQVSSTGVLSNVTAQAVTDAPQVSMDISPDGKWLVALDGVGLTTPTVKVYQIASTGGLSLVANYGFTSINSRSVSTTGQVRFSPDNAYIAVAMGGDGDFVLPFNTSTGALQTSPVYYIAPATTSEGDNALAFDGSDNLYVARAGTTGSSGTTGIYYTPVGSFSGGNSALTQVNATMLAATDSGARALTFAKSYGYLYAGNTSANTLNAFTVATSSSKPTLTAIGSSISAPTGIEALAVDSTSAYLYGAGTGYSDGLQLYTIGSTGALTTGGTDATGTAIGYPEVAVTH